MCVSCVSVTCCVASSDIFCSNDYLVIRSFFWWLVLSPENISDSEKSAGKNTYMLMRSREGKVSVGINPCAQSLDNINMIKTLPSPSSSSQAFLLLQSCNDILSKKAIYSSQPGCTVKSTKYLSAPPLCLSRRVFISIMVCAAAWWFLLINPGVTGN